MCPGCLTKACRISGGNAPRRGTRTTVNGESTKGLVAIGAEGRLSSWTGGSVGASAWRPTFEQPGDELAETGRLSAEDLVIAVALFDDPKVGFLSPAFVAA